MMRGFCPRGFCPEGAYVLMELCMEGVWSEGGFVLQLSGNPPTHQLIGIDNVHILLQLGVINQCWWLCRHQYR